MLMDKIRPYLELPYPITVVMIFLAYTVGLVMGSEFFPTFYIIIGFFAFFAFIGGFNTLNAIFDVESDRISKSYRPIPSGKISTGKAFIYSAVLFLVSNLIIYSFFRFEYFVFFIIMTLFSIFYSVPPTLKRFPIVSDFIIAITYTLFPLIIGWGVYNSFELIPWPQFLIIFLFGLAALFSKNFEDYEADLEMNSKTLVVILGLKKSFFAAVLLYFISFLSLLFLILNGKISFIYAILFIVLIPLLYCFKKFYKEITSKNAFSFFKWLTMSLALIEFLILFAYLYEVSIKCLDLLQNC